MARLGNRANQFNFKNNFIYLCVFIFGCAGSSLLCNRLFLIAASRGYSLVVVHGLLIVASLAVEHRHMSFSSCGTWA